MPEVPRNAAREGRHLPSAPCRVSHPPAAVSAARPLCSIYRPVELDGQSAALSGSMLPCFGCMLGPSCLAASPPHSRVGCSFPSVIAQPCGLCATGERHKSASALRAQPPAPRPSGCVALLRPRVLASVHCTIMLAGIGLGVRLRVCLATVLYTREPGREMGVSVDCTPRKNILPCCWDLGTSCKSTRSDSARVARLTSSDSVTGAPHHPVRGGRCRGGGRRGPRSRRWRGRIF